MKEMETVKAKCCDDGSRDLQWEPVRSVARGRWVRRIYIDTNGDNIEAYAWADHCHGCGTNLEAPKPPRKIVLDEEAREILRDLSRGIRLNGYLITSDWADALEAILAAANHTGGE